MLRLTFNGYRLDLGSGGSFPAENKGITSLPDGVYEVDLSSFVDSGQSVAITSNYLSIKPKVPTGPVNQAFYLYDRETKGISGIRAEPAFFFRLRMLMPQFMEETIQLTVKEAAPWMNIAKSEKSVNHTGAAFVASVILEFGDNPPEDPTNSLSWKTFGKAVNKPVFGAIGVKSTTGKEQVAFVLGQSLDGEDLFVLEGIGNGEQTVSSSPVSEWDDFVVPENYETGWDSLPYYSPKDTAVEKSA